MNDSESKVSEMFDILKNLKTRSDFMDFLKILKEVRNSGHDGWDQVNVEGWIEGMDTFVDGLEDERPVTWQLIARILWRGLQQA